MARFEIFPLRSIFLLLISLIYEFSHAQNDLSAQKQQKESTDDGGVVLPSKCETCKILAIELEERFGETGKSSDILRTSYSYDDHHAKSDSSAHSVKKYRDSELRLIESLENVCERILQYNMHKEHTDSKRFAKGQSQTMRTLHDLVGKGVKVELGIPYELWDTPSVEITTMKQHCEKILEDYEPVIENWFFSKDQDKPSLVEYLCENRVLKNNDERICLYETGDAWKTKKHRKGDEL